MDGEVVSLDSPEEDVNHFYPNALEIESTSSRQEMKLRVEVKNVDSIEAASQMIRMGLKPLVHNMGSIVLLDNISH